VGGNTVVGSARADRLVGVPRIDFIHGLSGDDVIDAGRGDDQVGGGAGDDRIAGGPGRDLLLGGAGDDVFVDGPGRDWIIDREGATTVRLPGGSNRITLADGRGGDRVRCASRRAAGLLEVDRRDRIDARCRGMRIRHGRSPSDARPAQGSSLRGDGSADNPFEADCDRGSTPTNCVVSSFPSRSLIGIWSTDQPPSYRCPTTGKDAASKYLLNHTYVPWGTSVPNGIEIRGLGPIGVTMALFLTTDDGYAAGNLSGGPLNSATHWGFAVDRYQVVLHCTSEREASYRPL
jgi:hypothetical protein